MERRLKGASGLERQRQARGGFERLPVGTEDFRPFEMKDERLGAGGCGSLNRADG